MFSFLRGNFFMNGWVNERIYAEAPRRLAHRPTGTSKHRGPDSGLRGQVACSRTPGPHERGPCVVCFSILACSPLPLGQLFPPAKRKLPRSHWALYEGIAKPGDQMTLNRSPVGGRKKPLGVLCFPNSWTLGPSYPVAAIQRPVSILTPKH